MRVSPVPAFPSVRSLGGEMNCDGADFAAGTSVVSEKNYYKMCW